MFLMALYFLKLNLRISLIVVTVKSVFGDGCGDSVCVSFSTSMETIV